MELGLLLVLIGLAVAVFFSYALGGLLVVVGLIVLVLPYARR